MVGVDGSENSLEACSAAGRLAQKGETRIDVVHVVPRGQTSEELAETNKMLNKAGAVASNGGVRAKRTVVVAAGSLVETLVRHASDKKSDLIVVGANGSGGFKLLLLGSVSSGLVAHARVPVLVVRSLASLKGKLFRHVLAAVDGSEASQSAVKVAARLATLAGAKLTALHVISVSAAAYSSGSAAVTGAEMQDRKRAEGYLATAKETAEDYGAAATTRIVEDLQSPVRGITEYASVNHVDLIVVGTRGLGGFRRLLLGSVANGVVNYASCSVLVVGGR